MPGAWCALALPAVDPAAGHSSPAALCFPIFPRGAPVSDTYRVLRTFAMPHDTHIKTFEVGESIEFDDAARATYYVDAGFVAASVPAPAETTADAPVTGKPRRGRKALGTAAAPVDVDPDPDKETDSEDETEDDA